MSNYVLCKTCYDCLRLRPSCPNVSVEQSFWRPSCLFRKAQADPCTGLILFYEMDRDCHGNKQMVPPWECIVTLSSFHILDLFVSVYTPTAATYNLNHNPKSLIQNYPAYPLCWFWIRCPTGPGYRASYHNVKALPNPSLDWTGPYQDLALSTPVFLWHGVPGRHWMSYPGSRVSFKVLTSSLTISYRQRSHVLRPCAPNIFYSLPSFSFCRGIVTGQPSKRIAATRVIGLLSSGGS